MNNNNNNRIRCCWYMLACFKMAMHACCLFNNLYRTDYTYFSICGMHRGKIRWTILLKVGIIKMSFEIDDVFLLTDANISLFTLCIMLKIHLLIIKVCKFAAPCPSALAVYCYCFGEWQCQIWRLLPRDCYEVFPFIWIA